MSVVGTIARRTFLVGSVAVAGGAAFGVYFYRTPYANPLLDDLEDGEAALTPYVRIDAEGVTLITPRADKGQGAYSAQAALIAEELDVELDQIKVDPGPPSEAYWNTAFSREAADFNVPGGGPAHAAAHGFFDFVMKALGLQVTGGSSTIPDGFDKLRAAGASARETLKLAASQKSGVPVAKLRTEAGAVLLPDGERLAYTQLAPLVAGMDPVQDVQLRDPKDWRLIGKPMKRVDTLAKSTGTQDYGIDVELDGMVHASLALNPAQGGAIKSFDDSAAIAIKGVKKAVKITGGVGVVADDTWTAIQGARAVKAEWGPAVFPATMEEHWKTLSDSFTAERQNSRNRDDGDVDGALASGEVVEAEYRAPYLAHAPLEPINATVRVDDDAVEIWTGTQVPRFIQSNVSRLTGVPAEKITVHVLMMGGSFGHRLEDVVVLQATEIAMQMKGTPVKLTYSREEDMMHDFTRQIAMGRMRGVVKDGKVEAYDLGIAMPSVIDSQFTDRQGISLGGPDAQIVAGAWDQAFAIPNHRVTGYRAPRLAPISSWRAVGASSNGFFYNAGLDELIHAAGADPMEERLRLCNDPVTRKVLEAVAEMSNWSGADIGPDRGRGVALTQSFHVPCAEVVDVTNTADGIKIDRVFVAADVGTVVDPDNFENQVQGAVVWALGHAMNCETTYVDGVAEQENFDSFEGMRHYQTPAIEVRGLENGPRPLGIGEPPVPPAAAALAAAIFAATGKRLREMPFNKFVDFA